MEPQMRAGGPDMEGLCRAIIDWPAELRLPKREAGQRGTPPTARRRLTRRSGGAY